MQAAIVSCGSSGIVRGELLRLVFRERREVDGRDRAAARARAPAGADRIAFGTRRHDEQDLAVRDDGGDLAEARQLIGVRPVHVFDDQQLRRALRGRLDDLRQRQRAAALTGRDLHRLFQRGQLGIERRVDQVAEEDDLIDACRRAQRDAARRQLRSLGGRIGADAEQAQRQRRDRPPPGDWPKSKTCAE